MHRIEVSPALVSLGFGDPQQFEAQGYDIEGVLVVCAEYTWDVVNGGGTIDGDGRFTAGTTPGIFVDTVVASDQGITGSVTAAVAEMPVDRFAFDLVGDQFVGVPFTVTVTALDTWDLPVAAYDGPATLADTTGTIAPVATGPFVDGVWIGAVTIGQAATGAAIEAAVGTLELMHFCADGIPNGVYEVWANLYTGRHTRHYYGFTEAEASPSSV